MSNFTDKTQFDYLFDALAQKYPGIKNADGKNTLFQFSTFPIAASWKEGRDNYAYEIADAVPVNLDGFYVKGESLCVAYKHFIQSVKPKNGFDNPQYRKNIVLLEDYTDQILSIQAVANREYDAWAAKNKQPDTGEALKTKDQWLDDPFLGKAYQKKMNHIMLQEAEIEKEQAEILASMDAALSDAKKRLDTDQMSISTNPEPVPAITVGGNLASDKLRWDLAPEGQYDFDVTINASETVTTPWHTTVETKISGNCFRTSKDVKIDTTRIIADSQYELKVTAVGLEAYNITRGGWFSPDFVRPDIELVEGSRLKLDDFFGKAGCLHLLPDNILVMYKPTIKLTISNACYKQTLSQYENETFDWIELFGFRLNFGADARFEPIPGSDNTRIITISSPENAIPQVMGVISQVVYNGH